MGQETQHATHGLHPYVAAINPPLVKALIETYIPEGESILDPYAGGGGVLVEAVLANRPSAGGEINPLGIILAKAKTTYIPKEKIIKLGDKILANAMGLEKKVDLSEVDKNIPFWLKERNLREVVALSETFKAMRVDADLKTLYQAILSGTIRDVMLTYRGEIRLRKLQGKDLERFEPDTYAVFKKRYQAAAEKVSSLPKGARCDIENRDIRRLPFADKSFYGIICSPPYADDKNGVGYFQFSKNMLSFLGFTPEKIKSYRSLFHGMTKEDKKAPKSASLARSLRNIEMKKDKHKEAVAFYADYAQGLSEMTRVTRKKIIIVVGNRVLARTEFDNAAITIEIFKNLGIELEHHYTRELKKKRIANLGGDGGGINIEHVLVFTH